MARLSPQPAGEPEDARLPAPGSTGGQAFDFWMINYPHSHHATRGVTATWTTQGDDQGVEVSLDLVNEKSFFPLSSLPRGEWVALTDGRGQPLPLMIYLGPTQLAGQWI